MKYFVIFLILTGFSGIILTQQVFADDSSFDSMSDFSEIDFDTGRFSYFQYGEKFYQYKSQPLGAPASESYNRCHFTSDFVLSNSSFSDSGNVIYRFPNDMVWPGGYKNSTFYVVRSPSFDFPEDHKFEKLTPTKTDSSIVLEFDIITGLNTFVANSTAFWDSQRSQIIDCTNPFDFEKQEYEYYDSVYTLKVQQNRAKMLGLTNDDFLCKSELVPILRNDGSSACVKPETIPKLIERGWTKNISEINHDTSSYMDKVTPTLLDFKNTLSESQDIDVIFSKFGKPHDDIGSGIHIYMYELNDKTQIWIGYVDDIWYVKHVDVNGKLLKNLFVKDEN